MEKIRCKLFLFFALFLTVNLQAQVAPIAHGHAHNDYVHKRPLFEALESGFTSIEIDVYLHEGELKVAHLPLGLGDKQNIQQLYLDPIAAVIDSNNGRVYRGFDTTVIFMIDFKTAGAETYAKLKEVLKPYERFITLYRGDSVIRQGAINILISGANPIAQMLTEENCLATVDGALGDMDNAEKARVITRYSDPWERYFTWKGGGKMPVAQRAKLDSLVAKAHSLHKHIRFYHIPDKPLVWKTLLLAGVDWINTNKLKEFQHFYEITYGKKMK